MLEGKVNESGFTLIEVLLSIILLFIILVTFMGFFTQSALFSHKNEQKLGTIETAQKVINLVEENVSVQELTHLGIVNTSGAVIANQTNGTYLVKDKATIETIVNKTINSSYLISGIFSNNSDGSLIQFKVIVQDPANPESKSETYTYIRR